MKNVFEFICEIGESGKRLDIFLFEKINKNTNEILSRNRIKSLIENQCVEKDNKVITSPSVKTISNSKYRINVPPPISAKPEPQNIPLDIIYEDQDIIVVNKPAGMVVHPGFGNQDQTLVNALLYHCKGTLSGIGGVSRPGIVHRIDKDTSGILVSAKNDFSHLKLSTQFNTTPAQLLALRGLLKADSRTLAGLAEEVGLSSSTMVGVVDRLEKKGLLVRNRAVIDRRAVNIIITDAGKNYLKM